MRDYGAENRDRELAALTDAIVLLHPLKMTVRDREGYRILRDASMHIYSEREMYLTNAVCAHCGLDIELKEVDGIQDWIHEDDYTGCDLDGDFVAEPATNKKTERRRAA